MGALRPAPRGAAVVVPREGEHKDPAALARLLRDERITVAHFVPSLLRPILDEPPTARCADLRAVFCGGEGMPRDVHDRFFETLPGRVLSHFYGPTEAAISCLYHDCDPSIPPGAVPIGTPVSNMRVYLLDETLHPVPEGVAGEIFIGGSGLARGYLARPDLTADRFVPDPVSGDPGARLYRSGDLARMRRGAIEFMGRTDHQVKIRGYRIELAEVETALTRMPGIAQAVAAAIDDDPDRRLVAWVVANGEPPNETDMRAHLRGSLPEPMIPSAFVVLPRLPLGPNGKVDRKALPEPGAAPAAAAYVAPRTPAEEVIAGICASLLKREKVGVDHSFFELGGDSLLATRVVARMRAAFEIDFPLRRLFTGPTVRELAAAVEEILVEKLAAMDEAEAARRLEGRAAPGKGAEAR
ncbi:MAG: non-ribosomal peptide synthetase [Acidobacteria bacterium]|nr:non-ribosomal peptide synthetase [Acidobacteriota bacterium]